MTFADLWELALGKLGLKPREFEDLEHWQFVLMIKGHADRRTEELDKFRRILAAIGGDDPKRILPLPGDFDNVPITGTLDKERLLRRLGLHNKWKC